MTALAALDLPAPDNAPDHPDPMAINGAWSPPMLRAFREWKPSAIYVCGFASPLDLTVHQTQKDRVARYGHNWPAVPVYVGTSIARADTAAQRLSTMPFPELAVHLLGRVWLPSQAHADIIWSGVSKALDRMTETYGDPEYAGQWWEARAIGAAGVVAAIEAETRGRGYPCWDDAGLAVLCDDMAKIEQARGVGLAQAVALALGRILGGKG